MLPDALADFLDAIHPAEAAFLRMVGLVGFIWWMGRKLNGHPCDRDPGLPRFPR